MNTLTTNSLSQIGKRETAVITTPMHPTWGQETEVCTWEAESSDGIFIRLQTYACYSGCEISNISMSVIHSQNKYLGNTGNASNMASAKRWITKTINQIRKASGQ